MEKIQKEATEKAAVVYDGGKKIAASADKTAIELIPSDAQYPTGICGCCNVKDCGAACCLTVWCCGPCAYAMAMTDAKIEYKFGETKMYGFMPCLGAQLAFSVLASCGVGCPMAYVFYGYNHVLLTKKYDIREQILTTVLKTICCLPCMMIQDMNLALTKERTTWTIAPGVACPGKQEMTRLN
eukprot:CAMPEP_0119318378 /NCGR_PEP_ID=MMETSP1333-20130426/46217_1 /TAXON_ID=418940 /ORGANISM="Scyphosphaera apsteinii, Strain RCC1455" /LENGTH=182 /DNA_ID=CAMNT_0007324537 /DNA_START=35 /DNA_END=583 /DNA_ORIENTATION=+